MSVIKGFHVWMSAVKDLISSHLHLFPNLCYLNSSLCGILSHVPHRFSIQLLVDFDLARDWLDEELVFPVAADNGIQDVTILVAVDVFRGHLGNRDNQIIMQISKDKKKDRCEFYDQLP